MTSDINMTSNKPYLVGAFYDWISDNDLTPYVVVDVNVVGVQVPIAFVNDGQIVLNISSTAVGSIVMAETAIEFSARFGGRLEHLVVPYGSITAIYAKENGAGTAFAVEHPEDIQETEQQPTDSKPSLGAVEGGSNKDPEQRATKSKASLKVIK